MAHPVPQNPLFEQQNPALPQPAEVMGQDLPPDKLNAPVNAKSKYITYMLSNLAYPSIEASEQVHSIFI